jgi:hypothetical protein
MFKKFLKRSRQSKILATLRCQQKTRKTIHATSSAAGYIYEGRWKLVTNTHQQSS